MRHPRLACFATLLCLTSRLPAQGHNLSRQHPRHGSFWEETRLYFGLGPFEDPSRGVAEGEWRNFLDTVVTPRFPSGLSVEDVYGQWQDKDGEPVQRLRSKVVILDYPASRGNALKVEQIRDAWKQRTRDRSVLRVTHPVDISL